MLQNIKVQILDNLHNKPMRRLFGNQSTTPLSVAKSSNCVDWLKSIHVQLFGGAGGAVDYSDILPYHMDKENNPIKIRSPHTYYLSELLNNNKLKKKSASQCSLFIRVKTFLEEDIGDLRRTSTNM
jgi:hypothetical protein